MQTNTLAIVSLIAGILGFTGCPGLGSIIAIITGGMAKNAIRQSGGQQGGEQLAQWGTILGWVGLGLFALSACVGVFFLILGAAMGTLESSGWLPGLVF